MNATTKSFLRAKSTTCKAMGHTEQAAKHARRRCFAMLNFFGLNSVFLSTTPDDECSFRVRLNCKPHYWVSSGGIFQNGIIRLFCNFNMPNEQRTKFHLSSNFSETYTSNTPKCNVRWNATEAYSNNRRKYNQLYIKHNTATNWQTFKTSHNNKLRGCKPNDGQ